MVQIPASIKPSIEKFLLTVQQKKKIEAAYLYGSQAKGTAKEWSDIDLALISNDFSTDLYDEQLHLMQLAAKIDDRIEPRVFLPGDFNLNDPLAAEIQQTGIRIL